MLPDYKTVVALSRSHPFEEDEYFLGAQRSFKDLLGIVGD